MGLTHSLNGSGRWSLNEIVELSNGRKLRGKKFTFSLADLLLDQTQLIHSDKLSRSEKLTVHAFLNIPFGNAPIGKLRFQRPVPADPWPIDQILDCTKPSPRCPHGDMWTEVFAGLFNRKSEDCLRLNVFTPSSPTKLELKNLPVMVFIHGGGFVVHSAAHYGDLGICRSLCTKNVIVVTIQYRLGFFGFLCTGDEIIPGNMGLWDQTLALQWVNNNISAFGGNPNNITVFGQSAGAASANFLALSPHSRDLFQKMIVMSGSASCTFALNTKQHVRDACMEFAVESGFKQNHEAPILQQNQEMAEFFFKMPSHSLELSLIGKHGYKINKKGMLDLTPVIDGVFFPKPLEELLNEAPKKLIITGVTEHESLLFTAVFPRKNSLRNEIQEIISREFKLRSIRLSEENNVCLKNMYFEKVNLIDQRQSSEACVKFKLASDILIVNGVWDFADTMTKHGHVTYLYSFNHFHVRSFGVAGFLFPFKGATHCTELPYIFQKGIIGHFHSTVEEVEVSHRFATLLTNFAKYGNPNVTDSVSKNDLKLRENCWEPLDCNNTHKYFRFTSSRNTTKMAEDFCNKRPDVWRQIFKQSIPL